MSERKAKRNALIWRQSERGWSFSRIARHHGISRERVRQIVRGERIRSRQR